MHYLGGWRFTWCQMVCSCASYVSTVWIFHQSWEKKHLCFTQAITIPSFLWISIAQDVLRDVLELPFAPRHIKKKHHKVNPSWLHPSDSRWFSPLPSPSPSVACYRRTTKDICEKRNVHERLQCPPHWNTWGKVSSLTLWSIPAPQLEPQRLVPPPMGSFCFSG